MFVAVALANVTRCSPTAIGVAASSADTTAPAWDCRGQAQTFYAQDTVISAITVWSPPRGYADYQLRTLFILGTTDGYEDPSKVLYGPFPLVVLTIDPAHPIEYRWDFNSAPLSLPQRGQFAFVVMAASVNTFLLLTNTHDPYPDGILCKSRPILLCGQPGWSFCADTVGWDLCFRVEFCDLATAVRRRQWGDLKLLYR